MFLKRYKRFLADVRLPDGEEITVHCPNSGSMKGCQPPEARAWISDSQNPKRKLRFTLELIEVDGSLVCVNTQRPNALAEEAIKAGRIDALTGYAQVNREVKFGDKSRIDFQLVDGAGTDAERVCWVEVKNVTMGVGDGISRFPDAVTKRGRKHLEELRTAVEQGARGVLLFCVGRDDTRLVQPADDIDSAYGDTLRAVAEAGVEIIAHRLDITPEKMEMNAAVPVELSMGTETG